MALISYLKQGDQILIGISGRTFTVGPDHINYKAVLAAIEDGDIRSLPSLADIETAVREYTRGLITIDRGEVYYNGDVVHNVITDKLVDMLKSGDEIDPLVMFLENIMDNPSKSAIAELYLFMDANDLPITPDGFFLAYKYVSKDFTDARTGTFDNSIGATVEMDRADCDDDRTRTCSTGLHFCGLSYLTNFSGSHIMILKINPRDVVSIPNDYGNAKGRCCRYEVVDEHHVENKTEESAFDGPVDNRFTEGQLPSAEQVQLFKSGSRLEDAIPFITQLFTWFKKK